MISDTVALPQIVVEGVYIIVGPFVCVSASEHDQVEADVTCSFEIGEISDVEHRGGESMVVCTVQRRGELTLVMHPGKEVLVSRGNDTNFHFNAPVY
jgi:hypothetical protein